MRSARPDWNGCQRAIERPEGISAQRCRSLVARLRMIAEIRRLCRNVTVEHIEGCTIYRPAAWR